MQRRFRLSCRDQCDVSRVHSLIHETFENEFGKLPSPYTVFMLILSSIDRSIEAQRKAHLFLGLKESVDVINDEDGRFVPDCFVQEVFEECLQAWYPLFNVLREVDVDNIWRF